VVFGPSAGLPPTVRFDPEIDSEVLPRVADEGEIAEARIAQTLRVSGMKRLAGVEETRNADVVLLDDDGNRILIEIQVRERDPKQRDFEQWHQRLTEAARLGQTLEVWYFNIERLKLVVMHLDQSHMRIDELIPLDVWEKTTEGVFDRAQVVEEVEDWVAELEPCTTTFGLGSSSALACDANRTAPLPCLKK
jgi:hypothetical protein